jgi:RHS repeat-associated protein
VKQCIQKTVCTNEFIKTLADLRYGFKSKENLPDLSKKYTTFAENYFVKINHTACINNRIELPAELSELPDLRKIYDKDMGREGELVSYIPDKLYYFNANHLGSGSLITDENGNTYQTLAYAPWGEELINIRHVPGNYEEPYKFTGYERDQESDMDYAHDRYYMGSIPQNPPIFITPDRLWHKSPHLTSYAYCSNNPINRIDPSGLEDHVDDVGNVIAQYDNNDKSVYMHNKGTTQAQINEHRTDNQFDGNMGKKIGEIGGNIDVSTIMGNMLSGNSEIAYNMTVENPLTSMPAYKEAVQQNGVWDLKNNEKTIFGVAWKNEENNGIKTTFSFAEYADLSAADVGNYHAGYMGRRAGIHQYSLWKGAGFAETTKDLGKGKYFSAYMRALSLFNPFSKQSGDRSADYLWNTKGMDDSNRDMLLESLYYRKNEMYGFLKRNVQKSPQSRGLFIAHLCLDCFLLLPYGNNKPSTRFAFFPLHTPLLTLHSPHSTLICIPFLHQNLGRLWVRSRGVRKFSHRDISFSNLLTGLKVLFFAQVCGCLWVSLRHRSRQRNKRRCCRGCSRYNVLRLLPRPCLYLLCRQDGLNNGSRCR